MVYSGVLFLFLVWSTSFLSPPLKIDSLLHRLIDEPGSLSRHLDYVQGLVLTNRLDDAELEVRFLKSSRHQLNVTAQDIVRLNTLQKIYSQKQNVFNSSVRSYSDWSHNLAAYPHYRDGLYLLAQHSYVLFDDTQTRLYLREAVDLDPQFEQGRGVLNKLQLK